VEKYIFKAHKKNGEYHSALLKMSKYFFAILTSNANLRVGFLIDASPMDKERNTLTFKSLRGLLILQ
jgi:hypothetical protein